MRRLIEAARNWYRRRVYRPGRVLSAFVACDVKREIKVISIDRIDEGVILGQVRTNNVLYLSEGLVDEEAFGEPMNLEIAGMWEWTGQPWGGLSDGTSIADQLGEENVGRIAEQESTTGEDKRRR